MDLMSIPRWCCLRCRTGAESQKRRSISSGSSSSSSRTVRGRRLRESNCSSSSVTVFLLSANSRARARAELQNGKEEAAAALTKRREKKLNNLKKKEKGVGSAGVGLSIAVTVSMANKAKVRKGAEGNLRNRIMEMLMKCAAEGDAAGAMDCFASLTAAGLDPGPHSYHGLVVAHTLSGHLHGAIQSLRKEIASGLVPLEETFIAVTRLLGSKGNAFKGEEILGAMEELKFDISKAWVVLVEELFKSGYHKQANEVFLKGAKGVRAPDKLYDFLIEENCKLGDHPNAIDIAENMESYGRMATTFHYNCLLSLQAKSGTPEIAISTFEDMYYGEEYMKPDTESYNWIFEALVRDSSQDRLMDFVDLLGQMIEEHQNVQPNARTYTLLVEGLTKYCIIPEAVRYFHALVAYSGGMKLLYNDGKYGDPLSLYLRMVCRDGRAVELLEALEAMVKDNQPLTSRAMIVDRKGRTLVSSWIEPIQEEADLGYEVNYVDRYISEGGLTGERRRWVPHHNNRDCHIDPDGEGFFYTCPSETSFKERSFLDFQGHYMKLMKKLNSMGVGALGEGATETDVANAMVALKNKLESVSESNQMKPKPAYKMAVSELKAELEGQDLPTDGGKQVLYKRVMKARKENQAEGRPLWLPPPSLEEPEIVKEGEHLIARLEAMLANDNTDYYKKRFLQLIEEADSEETHSSQLQGGSNGSSYAGNVIDAGGNNLLENDEDEDFDEEEEEDDEDDMDNEDDEGLKDTEVLEKFEFHSDLSVAQKCKFMQSQKLFDASEMYRVEDAWGWSWENKRRARVPEQWTQEKEVEVAMKIMEKVIELGGRPTIGDCAMVLRAAIRASLPSAIISILRKANDLGYVFGNPLYDEVITMCVDLWEMDAAIAIATDLEAAGFKVPNEMLDKILERQA